MYTLEFHPAALRELRRLQRGIARATYQEIRRAINILAETPRPEGCRAVANTPYLRIRVVGVYRVVYEVNDQNRLVLVVRVARRGEGTYRRLP